MKTLPRMLNRRNDKTRLLLKFNYVSSVLSILFGFLNQVFLEITVVIPYVFYAYTLINLLNVFAFKKHQNLTTMAIVTSVLSLVCCLVITAYSGGINSPFIFVLGIIVLAGYVSTRLFGRIYLYAILLLIVGIYATGVTKSPLITNVIPTSSQDLFSLFSILFSVYLLGVIFGRNLLKTHHQLYKSKAEIERRIHEKETLLREVHHRVKNNLQTVSSLLNLQAKNTQSAKYKDLIKGSQNRVNAMAMIHEMLYMRDNLSKIEYSSYVKELGEFLIKTIRKSKDNIKLNIAIPDIQLGIDTAIPLGLLINEAITNSLKYAFKDGANGLISIAIKQEEGNNYTLYVGDNGVGFTDKNLSGEPQSLGLRLIGNLARQMKGSIEKDVSKKGTHYIIKFQDIAHSYSPAAA